MDCGSREYIVGRIKLQAVFSRTACILSVVGLVEQGFSQPVYNLTDLGYPYDSYSEAHAINSFGSVVGEYGTTNSMNAAGFVYRNGVRTDLGSLAGAPYAAAYGINATNQVVGESGAAKTHGFEWTNGAMTDLGTLWGATFPGTYSSAHAVNESGQIVGESNASLAEQGTIYAVIWSGGTIRSLGALAGNYSAAFGINAIGVIVGNSDVSQNGVTNLHAFVYTNSLSGMRDLGTLPGGDDYSAAFAINDSGVIVGESNTSVSGSGVTNTHAFVFQNGVMADLGTLGGSFSSASAINNHGQVVGYAGDSNGTSRAFFYNGATMVNLNDLIPPGSAFTNLSSADAINDSGQIAGSGVLADGSYHAYLLTPSGPLLLAITNPPGHQVFFAPATFPILSYVWDSAGMVTNVQILVDSTTVGSVTASPYTVTATNLAAGTHTLTAIAADDSNHTATNSIAISVVDSPPRVAITNPAANAVFAAPATFPIAASALDPDGTVTNVQFQINGAVMSNATAAPYSSTAAGLGAGNYTLTAIAWDNAGLMVSNSITISVVSDTPPTVTITNPSANASFVTPATIAVGASASDPDGNVTNVEFLLDGTAIANVTVAPYGATLTNLAAGIHTLGAVATDNAGLSQTNIISISVTNGSLGALLLLSPMFSSSSGFAFSFNTQTGANYYGQYTTQLTNAFATSNNWLTFTSLVGNGSLVWVTNATSTDAGRFYRIIAH